MNTKPRLPEAVKNLFADVFVMGNELRCTEDTQPVLQLLRHVLPDVSELLLAEASQYLSARDYVSARQLLEEVDAKDANNANVKAMLAACLYFQNDSLWNSYAYEVHQLPEDADALKIIASLESAAAPA
jgi:thioredoxin-like negative regulator of GroEL